LAASGFGGVMRPLSTPSAVPKNLALVVPAPAYLEAYQAALKTGWSANTTRDTSGEELIDIQADPDRFLRSFIWHPGQMINLGAEGLVPRLPGMTFWIWDGDFCGSINLRYVEGSEDLPAHCSGHIGYSIVPWKRRKGYATWALRALLPFAAQVSLKRVMVTCDPDNIGSRRVIEACGGTPVEPLDPKSQKYRFWVCV
jgi:predicted acetyltransferase